MAWPGWLNGWKLTRFSRKGWQTRRQVEMDSRACSLARFNPEAGIVRRYDSNCDGRRRFHDASRTANNMQGLYGASIWKTMRGLVRDNKNSRKTTGKSYSPKRGGVHCWHVLNRKWGTSTERSSRSRAHSSATTAPVDDSEGPPS